MTSLLLLTTQGFVFHPIKNIQNRNGPILFDTAEVQDAETFMTWQEKLETAVLDPRTSVSEKQVLVQDLLKQSPEIRKTVISAIGEGSVETLLPPKGQSRFEPFTDLIRASDAVRRQVIKDIIPKVIQDGPKVAERLTKEIQEIRNDPDKLKKTIGSDPEKIQETLRDPEKLREAINAVVSESKNIYSRTPEGLETPSYSVVKSTPKYELRMYGSYSVCSTAMEDEAVEDPFASGKGFNTLAGYLFGDNEAETAMEMTTPVAIERSSDGSKSMSFILPSQYTPENAPAPKNDNIKLEEVAEGQMVAAVEFPGFATEGEVSRQLETLLTALEEDGITVVAPEEYTILQYNPPYTIPIFRRNEITLKVSIEDEKTEDDKLAIDYVEESRIEEDITTAEDFDAPSDSAI
eukprot:CAMPEP_0117791880 /NCGR_PEP_ID=MMETSP0948-20121206/9115_1 /TAXON_ID=44440 /ORGANISM="Chattonella subsalsa, Strain CCMP2191" /LENGTH=405 /DNA_ID=CAMNT_0005622007 /DNA_START=19 /DNA_END=1237 /DNA_ORIENTATION=-